MLRCGFAVVFLCILPLRAQAQTVSAPAPAWTLDGAAFSASPAAVLAAAAQVKAEPDAEVTVFFEQEDYRFAADGHLAHVHTLLYRVETKDGVERWSSVSEGYNPWYQDKPAIRARVIAPGGQVSELDPKTLTDGPARNEQDDAYSDDCVRKGPLPSVAVGSIVEEETVENDRMPFFAGGEIYRNDFSRSNPILRTRLTIELPESVPFKMRAFRVAATDGHNEVVGGMRRTTYDLTRPPQFVESDIDLATGESRFPYVEFSTGASWAAIASAYERLAEPQIQPETVRSLLPRSLPGGRQEKIAALVAVLHKQVRYTGIEFGQAALQPQTATEVLKRHYGDCKDKAAFLVALLRAAGIQANLALLATGPGWDVDPTLAGMNEFDHAIVHVPAAAGEPELWIDATAEFMQVGDLPYADKGREALLIAEGTTGLTHTPAANPEDSELTEIRDVTLQPYGPARIVETSETRGQVDDEYRSRYGGAESKEVRKDLDEYAQNAYSAKAITSLKHGDGADMTKPFRLELEMAKADRGSTSLIDAAVAITPSAILSSLPRWFRVDPRDGAGEETAAQKADRAAAVAVRASSYLVEPYVTTWQYRIHLPEGFTARALPEDKTYALGPATLTQHFSVESGVVLGTFHFDTTRPAFTAEEALATRKAVLELERQNALVVTADEAGAALFAKGKIREAFTADRARIAAHPADSTGHLHFAVALEEAGLGEQARAEAKQATTLDPKLAVAFYELGLTLQSNRIGVDYGVGFDLAGAIAAYRRASELDPENTLYLEQLAITEEYDKDGERYGAKANLADSVRMYRRLKTVDAAEAKRLEDNLLYALLYSHQYAELLTELAPLPMSAQREALAICATAASKTVAAALERADRVLAEERSGDLRVAGGELLLLGLYPQAGDLFDASISSKDRTAAQTAQQVALFRSLKHVSADPLPATDPTGPVHRMLTSMVDGTMQAAVPEMLDRNAFGSDAEWEKNLKNNDSSGYVRRLSQQSQLSQPVMRDLILTNAKLSATGDDTHGYKVTLRSLGAAPATFFVSRDEGRLRIVADQTDYTEVGNYALYLVRHGRETEARSLLDWMRELVHRGGGDDPLEGNFFAHFWSVDSPPPAAEIEVAALALTLEKVASHAPLEAALAASAKAPDDDDLNHLLATAYLNHAEPAAARPYLDKLLAKWPNSMTAIRLMGRYYGQTGDLKAWSALLETRLAKRPDDVELLREAVREAETAVDFAAARKVYGRIMDSGKATASDWNGLAWLGLFDDHLDDKTIEAAQQAVIQSKRSFATVHTLACLYAAQGKTTEARQLLLEAMNTGMGSEPNPEVWFGFGSIYEQYGANDAAIAAYRKVEAPDKVAFEPTGTYVLAQTRLKRLHAE